MVQWGLAMSLIPYSSSDDSDGVCTKNPPAKRRKPDNSLLLSPLVRPGLDAKEDPAASLPALPASFHDLYSSTVRTSTADDSSLHGGRKRVTPHVDGNWAGHVFVECERFIIRADDGN